MKVIEVFICEDDIFFCDLLTYFLEKENEIKIVGTSTNKVDLLKSIETIHVDVLLLDLNLDGSNHDGIDVAMEIKKKNPLLKTIILSSLDHEEIMTHAITFGRVANYITKEHYKDIPDAIRSAHNNQSGIHHSAAQALINNLIMANEQDLKRKISSRQIEILNLLAQGYTRKEISQKLFLNEQSINNEICKVSSVLKGKFPYLEWLRIKKHKIKEIIELAKKINIIP